MIKILQNKLKQLVKWLLRIIRATITKSLPLYENTKTWALNIIRNTIPSLWGKSVKWWKKKVAPLPSRILSIFADNIYGVWLPKKRSSLLGYLILFVLSLSAIIWSDKLNYTRAFIHTVNGNEAIVGVFTVLLALLVPIAIALIEDARESVLARQTIVRRIIRLQFAPIILLLACFFLFIPQGLHMGGESLTLRSLYVSVLVCCAWFVLASLYRSYRWLSDGSEYSDGVSKDGEPPADPQTGAFFSYKFSVLVQELNSIKGYQTWTAIWARWFPVGYEDALHGSFFERVFDVLDKRRIKKYLALSLELEAYAGSLNKRNIRSVQYEYEYPKKFLSVYSKIHKILYGRTDRDTRAASRIAGLWRSERAIDTIVNKIIDNMLTNELIWHLFEAMGEYAKQNNLTNPTKGKLSEDSKLTTFLEKYFDTILDNKLDAYRVDSYFITDSYWAVTYTNLYVHHYNISFIVADAFKEWLFNKLSKTQSKSQNHFYRVDTIVNDIFPEVDPITFGALMWFFYKSQNTTDSNTIVELIYKEGRPIGMMGRIMTGTWSGSEDEDHVATSSAAYSRFNNQLENSTIKLFATMYRSYLTQFWNLDEIIETIDGIDRKLLDEHEVSWLEDFQRHIELIRDFYKEETKEAKAKS